jgi:hypothetical protein
VGARISVGSIQSGKIGMKQQILQHDYALAHQSVVVKHYYAQYYVYLDLKPLNFFLFLQQNVLKG